VEGPNVLVCEAKWNEHEAFATQKELRVEKILRRTRKKYLVDSYFY
jgi:hypothetical protein